MATTPTKNELYGRLLGLMKDELAASGHNAAVPVGKSGNFYKAFHGAEVSFICMRNAVTNELMTGLNSMCATDKGANICGMGGGGVTVCGEGERLAAQKFRVICKEDGSWGAGVIELEPMIFPGQRVICGVDSGICNTVPDCVRIYPNGAGGIGGQRLFLSRVKYANIGDRKGFSLHIHALPNMWQGKDGNGWTHISFNGNLVAPWGAGYEPFLQPTMYDFVDWYMVVHRGSDWCHGQLVSSTPVLKKECCMRAGGDISKGAAWRVGEGGVDYMFLNNATCGASGSLPQSSVCDGWMMNEWCNGKDSMGLPECGCKLYDASFYDATEMREKYGGIIPEPRCVNSSCINGLGYKTTDIMARATTPCPNYKITNQSVVVTGDNNIIKDVAMATTENNTISFGSGGGDSGATAAALSSIIPSSSSRAVNAISTTTGSGNVFSGIVYTNTVNTGVVKTPPPAVVAPVPPASVDFMSMSVDMFGMKISIWMMVVLLLVVICIAIGVNVSGRLRRPLTRRL
jgi:hypothetical protein